MTIFNGELPLTVVAAFSLGLPARAKVKVVVRVFAAADGANRHFLRAASTCAVNSASPDLISTLCVPDLSTTSCAVTVPCFLACRAAIGYAGATKYFKLLEEQWLDCGRRWRDLLEPRRSPIGLSPGDSRRSFAQHRRSASPRAAPDGRRFVFGPGAPGSSNRTNVNERT
jgi:hypothetical protein